MALTPTIATALIDGISGTPSLASRCSGDFTSGLSWLETVAAEPVQRGPDALAPQSAAALLAAYHQNLPAPLFDRDAWLGLAWLAHQTRQSHRDAA